MQILAHHIRHLAIRGPTTRTRVDAPVAIRGWGSSGTNLIRRMLDAHPEMACSEEMSIFDLPPTYSMDIRELRQMYWKQEFTRMDEVSDPSH